MSALQVVVCFGVVVNFGLYVADVVGRGGKVDVEQVECAILGDFVCAGLQCAGNDVAVGGTYAGAVNLDVGYGAFCKHQGECHLFGGDESYAGAALNL